MRKKVSRWKKGKSKSLTFPHFRIAVISPTSRRKELITQSRWPGKDNDCRSDHFSNLSSISRRWSQWFPLLLLSVVSRWKLVGNSGNFNHLHSHIQESILSFSFPRESERNDYLCFLFPSIHSTTEKDQKDRNPVVGSQRDLQPLSKIGGREP